MPPQPACLSIDRRSWPAARTRRRDVHTAGAAWYPGSATDPHDDRLAGRGARRRCVVIAEQENGWGNGCSRITGPDACATERGEWSMPFRARYSRSSDAAKGTGATTPSSDTPGRVGSISVRFVASPRSANRWFHHPSCHAVRWLSHDDRLSFESREEADRARYYPWERCL